MTNIDELVLKVGATHYSPAPMRAVRGWSFTFEQLQALIAEYEAGSEPFGWWHQGAEEGESDFHLYESHAGEDCETCIPLYARPDPRVAELERQRDEYKAALIHIQQVACSGSPELGIAQDALAAKGATE